LDATRRKVFVGRRLDTPDAWQMPQGGIDPGESPLDAGLREMREEIGTDRASLLHEHPAWLTYDLPSDMRRRMWGGRYRGQAQRWLAFVFEGADAYTRLDAFELAADVQRLRLQRATTGSNPWFDARYGLALALYRSGKSKEARQMIDATAILHPELGGGELRDKFERLRQRLQAD